MVECALDLDLVFGCLADPTRRDILQRVSRCQLSVSEIAQVYDVTLAAISKHLKILEKARLIIKRRQGKQQIVQLAPAALKDADEYLQFYRRLWEDSFDALDVFLSKEM
ncbi:MAG TPA: metalloregulator ArsR/SmtB family transcription factor [Candidatus Saccharimonadales bacterium]|jgi:DNA-binding transcriptional ArsR family regulator|nr:metalloregulator ArsR/SmtB family transcription factor [Candidatus Saccharimonadales bacterium]